MAGGLVQVMAFDKRVVGGVLVKLVQRGRVVNAPDEVGQRLAVFHQAHAVVNQLCGDLPDDMHADDDARVLLHHQLEYPLLHAHDLAARHILIECPSDDVRDFLLDSLVLGHAKDADFRDGVDAVREMVADLLLAMQAEHVGDGHAALVHAGGGQSGKPDDVTDGEDGVDGGTVGAVDLDVAAFVGFDADVFQAQALHVAATPGGVEKHVRLDRRTVGQHGMNIVLMLFGQDFYFVDTAAKDELHPARFHLVLQLTTDFTVEEGQYLLTTIDEADLRAHDPENGRVLAANDARPHDDDALRDAVNGQNGVRIVDEFTVERDAFRMVGIGAGGDEDELGLQRAGVLPVDLDRAAVHDAAEAVEVLDTVEPEILLDALLLGVNDMVLAEKEVLRIGRPLERLVDPEEALFIKARIVQGGFLEGLGGKRAGVGAGPAHAGLLFDYRHGQPVVGGLDRSFFPGRAGTDDNQIVEVFHKQHLRD